MSKIIGIGACVLDTLITLPTYPAEDTKLRATAVRSAGGGPAATGLVAAAKLGESAGYIGVLSADGNGDFLRQDFEKYGVSTAHIDLVGGCRAFTSTVWLAADTASRTCVFDRGTLPALQLNTAKKAAIREAQVLLIDGNEMDAAEAACQLAKETDTTVLYDCGGLYEGVERLLALTDVMIPSEEFALGHSHQSTAEAAAQWLFDTYHPRVVVITQGKNGGLLYDGTTVIHYPAFPVEVVDSNGSGDVFHGAFAAALCKGYDYHKACIFASAVSAIKCTGIGSRASVPSMATVKTFLKENGYEL